MKKIALALPVLAAALLATSACVKHDDTSANTTISEVNSTEEIGPDANSADPAATSANVFANDASEPGNTSEPLGNAQ